MIQTIKCLIYKNREEQFSYIKLGLGILVLLVCGLRLTRDFNAIVDISFDDEVKYLRYGLNLFDKIRSDWGPTYNIWYKFLSIFEQRPIELYLLNYKVLILLTAISFFCFLYSYGLSFAASLWVSLCLLISNTNIINYPRISQFVVCFFLCCLVINRLFIKSKPKQYIIICFATFIGAFARMELMLSFLIFLIFIFYQFWKKYAIKEWIFFSLPFIFIMLFLLLIFKSPANTYMGKERLYGVFCQHYTLKYIYTHKADYNIFIDWIAFSKEQFPGCETFLDIVVKYPLVVIQGIALNAKLFLLIIFTSISDVLFPKMLYDNKSLNILSLFLVFILLIIGLLSKKMRTAIWLHLKREKELFFILMVFALPGFASSMFFFPRPHYLLFLLIPIIFLLTVVVDYTFAAKKIKMSIMMMVAAVFVLITPSIERYKTPCIISGICPNQSYKEFIRILNKEINKPHVIFSNILNLSMMTDKNFSDFGAEDKYTADKTFIQYVQEQKIDYILVTEFLLQDRRLKKDSTWLRLIANPDQFGFRKKILFKDCPTYLLYKE